MFENYQTVFLTAPFRLFARNSVVMKHQYTLFYLLAAALLGLIVSSAASRFSSPRTVVSSGAGFGSDVLANGSDERVVRIATFNVAMNRKESGMLVSEMENGKAVQIRKIAEVIQRVRPDVVLINEIDHDGDHKSVELFREKYLSVSQQGQESIAYPFVYVGPVNTGVESGLDINQDGKVSLPDDGFGFGNFPGQYGMALLSKFPIDMNQVRTFQNFLWKDMPDGKFPTEPGSNQAWYPHDVLQRMRLSSKSHWDVPVTIEGKTVHLICSHPTPPVFDGPEDRNGCRNHDEIRMIADYVSGQNGSSYLIDDNGRKGGLSEGTLFVVLGDLNADPFDGDSSGNAADQLTGHPLIDNSKVPASKGAVRAARLSGQKNNEHRGNHAFDTADFNDHVTGNMRVDYCLPSKGLRVTNRGVFWPAEDEPGFRLNNASDHHLVWIDIRFD